MSVAKQITRTRITTHAAASRIKRVRIGGAIRVQPKVVNKEDHDRMQQLLKSISEGDVKVEKWAKVRNELTAELHKLMNMYRLPELANEYGIAEIGRTKGRAVNTIDPRGFHKSVPEDDFFDCIKVSNEKAKNVLSGKELDKITDTEPGKLGPEAIKVTARELKDAKK